MSNALHKWSNKYECCINCGTTEDKHHSKGLCIKCAQIKYVKNNVHMCSICNKEGRISKTIDNKKICNKCYAKYYIVKRQCDLCHKIKVIAKVTDGKSICSSCYSKFYAPKKECEICHSIETVATKIDEKIVCKKCYKKCVPLRLCSECNKMGRIEYKKYGKEMCSSCYSKFQRPKSFCSNCGKLGITKIKINDVNICPSCYDKFYRPKRTCSICNKRRIIKKIIDDKFICDNCYINYAPKRICNICGIEKPIKKIIDGRDICTQCYTRLQNTCNECGQVVVSFNYNLNICDNCAYKKKLIKLIEESRSKFTSEKIFQLYENYIYTLIKCNYAGAKMYYKVINEYNFFKLLDDSCIYIEDRINELRTKIHFPLSIQNYFFMKGFLKVESDLEIFNKIHSRYINKIITEFNSIFSSYSISLIEIKKRLISRGWNNKFSSNYYLQCLREAFLFFDFLYKTGTKSINELGQNLLDDYVVNYCTNLFVLKKLIKFINKNIKLFRTLKILEIKTMTNLKNSSYSQYEKEAIFNLLNSSETSIRDKIIAYLVLIYGMKIPEIVNISLDDLKISKKKYYLYAHKTWITLNDTIGTMIWSYIKSDRKEQLSLGHQKEWLFTGSKYYKPISSKYAYSILTKFGIYIRRSYPTLFKDYFLNYDISPSVLIDGLGMNIGTTVKYYNYFNINGTHEINTDKRNTSRLISNIPTYIVYILSCSDGSYYTGYTSDIKKRIKQHQDGTGCTYTKTRTPVELVYTEELPDKPSALKREKQIKKLTIFDKEKLIEKSRAN